MKNCINNDFILLWIENGVLFGKYKEGVIINRSVAEKVLEDREILCKGEIMPTIWDCTKIRYWTKDGRDFQSTDRNYKCMKAGAVIYTHSYVATIIINFFIKFTPPPVPVRFFTDELKAIKWISKFT